MSITAVIAFASAICGVGLAAIVLLREPRSLAKYAFLVGLLLFCADNVQGGLLDQTLSEAAAIHYHTLRSLITASLTGTWLLFSVVYARGNYREHLAKWRFILGVAFALPLLTFALVHRQLVAYVEPVKPDGAWLFMLNHGGVALSAFFLAGAVLSLMNLERTFRASIGTMRWQIKYMVLGVGLVLVAKIYTRSQVVLYSAFDAALASVEAWGLLLGCFMMMVSLIRKGHFKLEIYPSQVIIQSSITVTLAGTYLLIVGVLAYAVSVLGGTAAFPLQALFILISMILLTALMLSDRIKRRLRLFVSRHFRRPLYDYRQVWTSLNECTFSVMDEMGFCRAVAKWISETFQSLSVTIWLVDAKLSRLRFGASTATSESQAASFLKSDVAFNAIIRGVEKSVEPVDLEVSDEPWVEPLRRWNPDLFGKGSHRVCVPMRAKDELLGLIVVGDRVSGDLLTIEDLDLLKCVGGHVATILLEIQLSQRLLQAREMEAFQAMSAFFVHDLKNTASSLSLMLNNLETHFADPEFRKDALRAVASSVTHMKELIHRLNSLRHELTMKPVEADLNQVVAQSLEAIGDTPKAVLTKSLQPLPRLLLDPEQIQKVIVNLLLNSVEAVGNQGEIKLATGAQNGWAVLSVTDNGCGMSAEFIAKSLFRPFQTTKKSGLGIGMFHSKLIVEAHRGRIEVESEPGQGSTFRVLLPLR